MNIRLLETKVNSVNFELSPSGEVPEKDGLDFNLRYKAVYTEKQAQVFAIAFSLKLSDPTEFMLELEYTAWFVTSEPIDVAFKKSDWTAVNAPAIAFPYLRAYVTNFTVMNGMAPQILPTINFIEMAKREA
jgi:preprotein translocase subunit SecB